MVCLPPEAKVPPARDVLQSRRTRELELRNGAAAEHVVKVAGAE